MARSALSSELSFSDLDTPPLDMGADDAPEAMLHRLREQNSALDRLRYALAEEEGPSRTFPLLSTF